MTDQLTSAGLAIDDLETRIESLIAELRAKISPNINADTNTEVGQFTKIFCERVQTIVELLQNIHESQYPDGAIGNQLTGLCRWGGTERKQATKSTVVCTVNLNTGTYNAGTLIAHVENDATARFVNVNTIVAAAPGNYTLQDFIAETAGPVPINSSILTVIAEPVTGWNSIVNTTVANIGTDTELDSALRLRRSRELNTGSTSVDAIQTAISQLDGISWVSVTENTTETTDSDGRPPKSINVNVHATTATGAEIAAAIFASKAGGIEAYGTDLVSHIDLQGNSHPIYFTPADEILVYCAVDIVVDSATYEGDDVVKAAILAQANLIFGVGDDISVARVSASVLDSENGVTGVLDVTEVRLGTSSPPAATTNLAIAFDEIGLFALARIVVNATAG